MVPHPGLYRLSRYAADQVWLKEVWSGVRQGYKLILQKPDLYMRSEADRLQVRHKGKLCRVHIAYDLIPKTADQFKTLCEALDHGLLLKWRPAGPMRDEEHGWYSVNSSHRKRTGRNLACR